MGEVVSFKNCPGCCSAEEVSIASLESTLVHHQNSQLALCEQLERLADSLPYSVQEQNMLASARMIFPVVRRAHEFEEKTLFPLFEYREKTCSLLSESLERLRFEHWEDESYAMEISEGLLNYVNSPEQRNHEALGYMLRGFFEGIRRHIAFEREHVMPRLRTCGVEFA